MGGTVCGGSGVAEIECAEAKGLSRLRAIVDGCVVAEWDGRGQRHLVRTVKVGAEQKAKYVRAEGETSDGRKALSNPIYFRP